MISVLFLILVSGGDDYHCSQCATSNSKIRQNVTEIKMICEAKIYHIFQEKPQYPEMKTIRRKMHFISWFSKDDWVIKLVCLV